MSQTLQTPLTKLQLELLKLYSHEVSDKDLANIKELIGRYFADRLSNIADAAWDRNHWTQKDMENILDSSDQ